MSGSFVAGNFNAATGKVGHNWTFGGLEKPSHEC